MPSFSARATNSRSRNGPMAANLQQDDAGAFDLVVLLGVIDGERAVEPEANARALGTDEVVVPVFVLDDLLNGLHVRSGEDLVAARFVVESAPVALADVGLIADD